jgi:hypothetical protein
MKGNNSLDLNTATMLEALQQWADAQFDEPIKVTAISQLDQQRGLFRITLVSPDPSEPKATP